MIDGTRAQYAKGRGVGRGFGCHGWFGLGTSVSRISIWVGAVLWFHTRYLHSLIISEGDLSARPTCDNDIWASALKAMMSTCGIKHDMSNMIYASYLQVDMCMYPLHVLMY